MAWVSTDELLCASLTICPLYLQTSVSGTLHRHLKRAPQSFRMRVSVRVYAIVCQPLSASTSLHCDWILQVPFVEDHLRLLQERRRCTLKQLCVRVHVCVLKHSLCTCAVVTAGRSDVCLCVLAWPTYLSPLTFPLLLSSHIFPRYLTPAPPHAQPLTLT